MDFIDDSIDHEKYKDSKYPSLIMLRDSWVDRWLFIPMTKILKREHLFFIGFILVSSITYGGAEYISDMNIWSIIKIILYFLIFAGSLSLIISLTEVVRKFFKRYLFIEKAYFLDFIMKNGKVTNSQLKHFFNFSNYFRNLKDLELDNYIFKELYLDINIENSSLKNIKFQSCKINGLEFKSCKLENLDFRTSKTSELSFDNCKLINIQLDEGSNHLHRITRNLDNGRNYSDDEHKSYDLTFKHMDINSVDNISLKEIQAFIQRNKIEKKDIDCTSSELKDKFFAKLEGRE